MGEGERRTSRLCQVLPEELVDTLLPYCLVAVLPELRTWSL